MIVIDQQQTKATAVKNAKDNSQSKSLLNQFCNHILGTEYSATDSAIDSALSKLSPDHYQTDTDIDIDTPTRDTDTDTGTNTDTDTDTDIDTDTDTNADTNPITIMHTDTDTNTDMHTDMHTDTEPNSARVALQ